MSNSIDAGYPTENQQSELTEEIYAFASGLLVNARESKESTITYLVANGLDYESARIVVNNIASHVNRSVEDYKDDATKAAIIGGFVLFMGAILTLLNIGFIFYGAIIFGFIQLMRGLYKLWKVKKVEIK